jgi:hypothetical protein
MEDTWLTVARYAYRQDRRQRPKRARDSVGPRGLSCTVSQGMGPDGPFYRWEVKRHGETIDSGLGVTAAAAADAATRAILAAPTVDKLYEDRQTT